MFHLIPHHSHRKKPFLPIRFSEEVQVKHGSVVETVVKTVPHIPSNFKKLPKPENFTVEAYKSAGIPLQKVNSKVLSNIDSSTAETILDKAIAAADPEYLSKTEE